jgi:hypothetical protein
LHGWESGYGGMREKKEKKRRLTGQRFVRGFRVY